MQRFPGSDAIRLDGRRSPLALAAALAVLGASPLFADSDNLCNQAGEAPDIIVGDIGGDQTVSDVMRWGTVGGITAYSFAATACNIGTCWALWVGNSNTHPVISQNLFDLKDGRFQQIGQSWIKHTLGADQGHLCGVCRPGDGSHLGVGCSDLYDAGTNGFQTFLGRKYSVNPYTGYFAFGPGETAGTGNSIYKRLQVHNYDLDPAGNPGVKYFVEVMYVSQDDATTGHGENNATYRPITVSGSAVTGIYDLTLAGPNVIGQPAIMAWKAADPSVTITTANRPGDGKLYLGTKVTYRGGGIWRYEYAIQNVNAAQAPLAISIPIPAGTTVPSTSYHDVDYHSDDIQDNHPWTRTTSATAVQWKAATLIINGLVPNALRWGTIYNFRIDASAAPGTHAITLGYADPPHPVFDVALSIPTLTPSTCDSDGICDPGETCASCPADCASQGGGSGCCGNASCEAGESPSACFADCGEALASESLCGDGIDGDRDGLVDCLDTDCCTDPACDGLDVDGDGHAQACDCNDADGAVWGTPGEATNLQYLSLPGTGLLLTWGPPAEMGGEAPLYDLIRATDPRNFDTTQTCLPLGDPTRPSAQDPENPAAGAGFFYLARAKSPCPATGPLGSSSSGTPHNVPDCP